MTLGMHRLERLLIRSDRLEMWPAQATDVTGVHMLWTAPGVRRFLWDDVIIPLDRTAAIVASSEELFRERGFGIWGAWLPARASLIGFGGFWYFRDAPEPELLFGVHEPQWGHGYATEIAAAIVAYGFHVLGFARVRASTDAENVASVRVLEKLGFRPLTRAVVNGLDTRFYELERPAASS